jgi:hypothetical protein
MKGMTMPSKVQNQMDNQSQREISERPEPEDDTARLLDSVKLLRFDVRPLSVPPFGGTVAVNWNVTGPPAVVHLTLNGSPVPLSGSRSVEVSETTTFRLVIRIGLFSRTLASATAHVDTDACVTGSISENDVASKLRAAIDAVDAGNERISQRRPVSVEIDASGIAVAARMKVAIDNFVDPKLDIDFVLGLRTRNGAVEPYFRRFAVDVDWPWWVTTLSAGVTKIIEEIVEHEIKGKLQSAVLAAAKKSIDGVVDQLPSSFKLFRIITATNRVDVTVCPAGDHVPHVVLGTHGPLGTVLGASKGER